MNYFISRHQGSIAWMHEQQQIHIDHYLPHLDTSIIRQGDRIYGTLPISLIAKICQLGAYYYHLELQLSAEQRGIELDIDIIRAAQPEFVRYFAQQLN